MESGMGFQSPRCVDLLRVGYRPGKPARRWWSRSAQHSEASATWAPSAAAAPDAT